MKIYKAMINIENNCPELFLLTKHCKIELSDTCQTACAKQVDLNHFKIVINRQWVENFDNHNLSAIIEHELLHVVLSHCSLLKTYDDKRLANVAMDCIINDVGHFFKDKGKLNSDLAAGVFLEDINKQYNASFNTKNDTSKDIYNFLVQNNDDENKSFDEGIQGDDSAAEQKIDLEGMLSDSDMKAIVKAYGEKSADLKQALDAIEVLQKNRKIKNEIEKFFTSNKAAKKTTIKKRNKRHAHIPYGHTRERKQTILMALDVSGSMLNPKDFGKLKMVIDSSVANGFKIDLIFGDTAKIGEFKDIKSNFDFSLITGGGGTDLKFIFDEKLNNYDCSVIVTDCDFDHSYIPTSRKNSLLFFSTSSKNKIDGFKTVNI